MPEAPGGRCPYCGKEIKTANGFKEHLEWMHLIEVVAGAAERMRTRQGNKRKAA